MARRVYFSFHYDRDNSRVEVVRNSWLTKPDREAAGFWDAAERERIKKIGRSEIEKWIDKQLINTSVTVVLIGRETWERSWVSYEIARSIEKGNALLGVRINAIKDFNGRRDFLGKNPLDYHYITVYNSNYRPIRRIQASRMYKTYSYIRNNGYKNMNIWIEQAARIARR